MTGSTIIFIENRRNDGFPDLDYFREEKENIQKVREENAEKRKAEWDIFIKYLNDNSKIYTV